MQSEISNIISTKTSNGEWTANLRNFKANHFYNFKIENEIFEK